MTHVPLPRVNKRKNEHLPTTLKGQTMSITVYSKPMCVQCDATYRALDKQGLDYTKVDLTEDPSALEFIKGLGYLIKAAAQASSMESGRVVNA